ncbi:LacI family DNA-binding transcriptional regulator [Orbaceae bacterium ESL0721]|nr:LacI family DNA-binding transcriptional regulator [Orbaceae bacterium ESL0721]
MASNRVTINDIARLADVSVTTVSHIFNKHDKKYRISELTRQKVLSIAERFRDQPHIHRYIIKANCTNTIGVIIPDMSNLFFSIFLHHLESTFAQKNIQLLITCSHYDKQQETEIAQNLLERKVDAMIVVTSLDDDRFYLDINRHTPVLFFDRYINNTVLPFITSEAVQSVAKLIALHAKQLDEFYFIGCDLQLTTIHSRLEGFKQGLQTAGLKLNSDWIISTEYSENIGYELIKKVHHKLGRIPKAIFTPSCNILQEILSYLVEIDAKKEDICLCSYDYNSYFDFICYPIDAIAQDYATMAKACVDTTNKLINFKPLKRSTIFIKPQIIWNRKR